MTLKDLSSAIFFNLSSGFTAIGTPQTSNIGKSLIESE